MAPKLPVFPPENHRCDACSFCYFDFALDDVIDRLRTFPATLRDLVASCEPDVLATRARPDEWSIIEYLCHVRDVFMTSTIRLHRARTEDNPIVDPMLNDLRVRRFRYNESHALVVLDEIEATAMGFIDEAARLLPEHFSRLATGPMGDQRTALWFVRHALHEALHHQDDIARLARTS